MLLPTIAQDIARMDEAYRSALADMVHPDKALQTTSDIELQFEGLILKPATKLEMVGPILIIIDALDESGEPITRKSLLKLLKNRMKELPQNMRIILTSRPEHDIVEFSKDDGIKTMRMEDIDLNSTKDDILQYVKSELTQPKFSDKHHRQISSQSEGSFQWAYVVCKTIIGDGKIGEDEMDQYKLVVESGRGSGDTGLLDHLYRVVLGNAIGENATGLRQFKIIAQRSLGVVDLLDRR